MMLKLAAEKPEVRVVNDQFGSPTYTKDLASKIKEILDKPAPFGVYHVTNQGRVSWYDLAKKTFELAGVTTPLIPISSAESGSKIKRPLSSALKNSSLAKSGLVPLRLWDMALSEYIQEIQ
jgi:dTDP-4-dehydrorhamnose reductase